MFFFLNRMTRRPPMFLLRSTMYLAQREEKFLDQEVASVAARSGSRVSLEPARQQSLLPWKNTLLQEVFLHMVLMATMSGLVWTRTLDLLLKTGRRTSRGLLRLESCLLILVWLLFAPLSLLTTMTESWPGSFISQLVFLSLRSMWQPLLRSVRREMWRVSTRRPELVLSRGSLE